MNGKTEKCFTNEDRNAGGQTIKYLMLFKAQHIVDTLDEEENERLPCNQVSNPVQ